MLKATVNSGNIQQELSKLAQFPKVLSQARRAAISRLKQTMQREAISEATQEYYVTSGQLRPHIQMHSNNGTVRLRVRGQRHSLAFYKLTPTRRPKGNKPYTLKAGVKRSGGMKPLKPIAHNKPFLLYDSVPVVRVGYARLPVMKIFAPAENQLVSWAEHHQQRIRSKSYEEILDIFHRYVEKVSKG